MTTPQPFKVLVADDMSDRVTALLRETPGIEVTVKTGMKPAELLAFVAPFHAILVRSSSKITPEVIDAAPELRFLGRAGIGIDNIDVKAASRRGIVVENTPSGNAVTTAEHAICLLCSLVRHIPQATASMRAGKWDKKKFQGTELFEKTLGVVGLGNIGRLVAERATGLKMKVIAFDPFLGEEAAQRVGAELVTLDQLFTRSDFITVHTPLTAETKGLIGAQSIARMKKGVFIVNAARGGIVDEAALLDALKSGHVAGAALDVFAAEPPTGSPLLEQDNVVLTPHLGASTDEAQEKVAVELGEQLVAFVTRGEIKNAVNVAPVSREVLPRLQPYLELAGKLGSLVGQLTRGINEVDVVLTGEVGDLGSKAVAMAALAGVLRPHLDRHVVNEVNAAIVAAERGIKMTQTQRPAGRDYTSAITVIARDRDGKQHLVRGAVFHVGERTEPRIVQVDQYTLEAVPEGRLVIMRNHDRPGVIGAVGTLFGQRGINVARLHLGLDKANDQALALWNVDGEIEDAVLDELRKLPHVVEVLRVSL